MKRKKYILTAEQAKEHKWGIVWFILSLVLGGVITYFAIYAEAFPKEYIFLQWLMFSGAVLTLYHFRWVFAKIWGGVVGTTVVLGTIVPWRMMRWIGGILIVSFLNAFILCVCLILGWIILFADIIMLIIKRPLVYQKLEWEYIDDGNSPE